MIFPPIAQIASSPLILLLFTVGPTKLGQTTAAAVSEDGKLLVLGDQTGSISAWRISDGSRMWTEVGKGKPIRDLAIAESDERIIALEGDNYLRILFSSGGVERDLLGLLGMLVLFCESPTESRELHDRSS